MCHDMTIDDVTPTGAHIETFWGQEEFFPSTMFYVFRQIYGKPNSTGCLENDFSFAGKTLQPSRSMIDGSIFDAQLMSCCNLREYLSVKKDIKELAVALETLPPPGFGVGVYADEDNEEDVPRNAEMFETERYEGTHVFALSPCHCVYVCVPHTLCLILCVCV